VFQISNQTLRPLTYTGLASAQRYLSKHSHCSIATSHFCYTITGNLHAAPVERTSRTTTCAETLATHPSFHTNTAPQRSNPTTFTHTNLEAPSSEVRLATIHTSLSVGVTSNGRVLHLHLLRTGNLNLGCTDHIPNGSGLLS
jgi:hypothetical protein